MIACQEYGVANPDALQTPGIHVIDAAGDVVDYYLHTARDR
jgi:hypothetical protein